MPKYLVSVSYSAEGARGVRQDGGTKRREVAAHAVGDLLRDLTLDGEEVADRPFPAIRPEAAARCRVDELRQQLSAVYEVRDVSAFYRSVRERLLGLPGVEAVGLIQSTPLTGKWTFADPFIVVGQPGDPAKAPLVSGAFVAFDSHGTSPSLYPWEPR